MEIVKAQRVDHHGIVAGVIKDLGIIETIDSLVGCHTDEHISTGEAVAGMIINGLGFTDRPMTLTPQFFENCPVELLFREGVLASDFNRFKLDRALDNIFEHGCDIFFANIATSVCKKEGIDTRFAHLDSTSFSLTGKYIEDSDENAIKVTHGYSKDHSPDLKQVVLELLVSQEGGIPLICKAWDGNSSDNEIFNTRAKALIKSFEDGDSPVYLIADSKLYSKENMKSLKDLCFITRIPEVNLEVNKHIENAVKNSMLWQRHTEDKKYQEIEVIHNDLLQRWIIVYSQPAKERAQETVRKKVKKEKEIIEKDLFHLQARRFNCKKDARKEIENNSKKWKLHLLDIVNIEECKKYTEKGRPKSGSTPTKTEYQVRSSFLENLCKIEELIEHNSCYVVGTNIPSQFLTAVEIIDNYSKQQNVEKGFRFLKDSIFFTSSFFIKKQSRIEAMLTVMTLALLVYSIAERRLRNILQKLNAFVPNQINKPVKNPTLRWIFQLMEGISRIEFKINNSISSSWTGLTELRPKILKYFGNSVLQIYQIS